MGKPPVPVIINLTLAAIGFGVALYGLVIGRFQISLIGAGISALSTISSFLFYRRVIRERRKAMLDVADSIERCIK